MSARKWGVIAHIPACRRDHALGFDCRFTARYSDIKSMRRFGYAYNRCVFYDFTPASITSCASNRMKLSGWK